MIAATCAAERAPHSHTVVIENMQFNPAVLTVGQGDEVVWVNRDLFPHTASALDKSFDSHEISAGGSWRLVPGNAGAHPYVCALHPTMKATLIVR